MSKARGDIDTIVGKAYDSRQMKRLLSYLYPYKNYVIIAFLALLVFTVVDLFASIYLYKYIIDEFIQKNLQSGLGLICLLYFLLILVAFGFQYIEFYLVNSMSQRSMFDLRMSLFRHLERMSLSFFNHRPVGSLLTRISSDIEALDNMFSNCVVFTFHDLLMIIGLLGIMLYMSPVLTLVTLAVLPLIILASIFFQKSVRASYRQVRYYLSRMNSFLQENISGMETVQIFGKEKRQFDRYSDLTMNFKNANLRSVMTFSLFLPTVEFLGSLSTALLLWYGGIRLLETDPALTFGTLAAFMQAAQRFFQPIRDLADKFNIMQTAMTASERVFNLLDTDETLPDAEEPIRREIKGAIEFRNVWFAYNEDEWILKDVSFKVEQGKSIALVGATGSGKSTIINLLFRFYDVQHGEVMIDGINIQNYDVKHLRSQMGLVLQDIFLFSGDIASNISLGREGITEDDIIRAAQAVQVDTFVEKLPHGYHSEVKERGATLSLGQRQLLSFARALAINPRLLALDEATSSIDTETERLIQKALETVMQGRTSVIVAHRLSTIQKSDEILVLHQGEIAERGSHQDLLQRGGLYWRLYQLQYKDQIEEESEKVAS